MLRGFRFAVVLAVLLAAPRLADACSCLAASPCRQFAKAAAVFAGDVVDVSTEPGSAGGPGLKIARVRVARAYKGPMRPGQVIAVEMPGGSSASCSLDIATGNRFVIYGGAAGGRVSTNLCWGSYQLESGKPWPELPPQGGVVSGSLQRYSQSGVAPPVPVPNVGVWIATPERRVAGKTDADGAFRLTGVPPGRWTVEFDLGMSEQASQPIELQSADDCAEIFASPRPRGQ